MCGGGGRFSVLVVTVLNVSLPNHASELDVGRLGLWKGVTITVAFLFSRT